MENGTQNIQAAKKALRREVLQRREKLSEDTRTKAALLLTERILGHQWYYLSDILLGFVSYGNEIRTLEILQCALEAGKKVYVPKVVDDDMLFYRIFSLEELTQGYKGIPEPSGDTEVYRYREADSSHTLMLMPGSVFDPLHNRMGYGRGFYDRFLADKEALQLRTIGVGFQCQLVEQVPCEKTDIRPYQVILV